MGAVWMFLELNFLWIITDYIPFFQELKMIFFLWLQHPDFQGALYIWYAGFMKEFDKIDVKVGPIVAQIKGVKMEELRSKAEELKETAKVGVELAAEELKNNSAKLGLVGGSDE